MNKLSEILRRIKYGTCEVVGLGRSNLALIEYLIHSGAADIVARDKALPPADTVRRYTDLGVTFRCGDGYLEGLSTRDAVIFRTPAIRPDVAEFTQAVNDGALLSSEIELYMLLTPSEIFGITGSDGKTTTTTLIHLMLSEHTRAFIGGNIGVSPMTYITDVTSHDISVLELSSFQLQGISVSPDVAVLTNITPNHLNWHIDMNEYVSAKACIIGDNCRTLVINADDQASLELVRALKPAASVTALSLVKSRDEILSLVPDAKACIYIENGCIVYHADTPETVLRLSDIKLPGRHNVANYMAAIGATKDYVTAETVQNVARTFGGVEHRLEFVCEKNGVRYYNSSIDSSPTRTVAALNALDCRPIVICGGSDKNVPFDTLAEALCTRAKAVVLTGQTAELIKRAILSHEAYRGSSLVLVSEPLFADAVRSARDLAKRGDTVLLSPACASFDAFRDFEHRGRTFKDIVKSF